MPGKFEKDSISSIRRKKLWAILACPVCRSSVKKEEDSLLCSGCGKVFPILKDKPVMLGNSRELSNAWDTFTSEEGMIQETPERSWKTRVKGFFESNINLSLTRIIRDQFSLPSWEDRILIEIGSGGHRILPHILNLDLHPFHEVDVIGDAHHLPFADGSVDGIISRSLLEHVADPYGVAGEFHRVLRRGGKVYIEVPFMLRFHECPVDLQRFTLSGLEHLFQKFPAMERGVCVGPSSALSSFIRNYLSLFSFCENQFLKRFLKGIGVLVTFPLKYLDFLLTRNPSAHHLAAGCYYLGRKDRLSEESNGGEVTNGKSYAE